MSTIRIETNQDDYTGGETIEGKVMLELDEAIPVRGVRIRFEAYERALWSPGPGRDQRNHVDTKTLFDEEKTLFGEPALPLGALVKDALKGIFSRDHFEVLKAGSHSYPFSFELPQSLPGDYESPGGSAIRYELSAYLDIPLRVDISATKRLTVYEPTDAEASKPSAADNQKSFLFESDAPLELGVALDRSDFFPGDAAHCRLTITNPSSKSIDAIGVFVRQIEDLAAEDLPHINHYDIPVAEIADPKVPRGETVTLDVDFELPKHPYATVSQGTLVKVRYELLVNLNIPWARDLEVGVPIVLHEKPGKPSGR